MQTKILNLNTALIAALMLIGALSGIAWVTPGSKIYRSDNDILIKNSKYKIIIADLDHKSKTYKSVNRVATDDQRDILSKFECWVAYYQADSSVKFTFIRRSDEAILKKPTDPFVKVWVYDDEENHNQKWYFLTRDDRPEFNAHMEKFVNHFISPKFRNDTERNFKQQSDPDYLERTRLSTKAYFDKDYKKLREELTKTKKEIQLLKDSLKSKN